MRRVDPSNAGVIGRTPWRIDVRRLVLGGLACALAALLVLPFDAVVLRRINIGPDGVALPLLDWLDHPAPRVLMTLAITIGVAILVGARPALERRRAAIVLLLAFVVTSLVTDALKTSVGRLRPQGQPDRAGPLWSPIDLSDARSFPSGHVSVATAITAAFWLASRRGVARNALWLVPSAMMLDRVCLGLHWPSDALGGAAVGVITTAGVAALASRARVDRLLARFGRGGSALGRVASVTVGVLAIARVWHERTLGRDPVSGHVVPGFIAKPSDLRVWLEPFLGPPLHLAREDVRALALPAAVVAALGAILLIMAARRFALRICAVGFVLVVVWAAVYWWGIAPPDRFSAKDREGIFVDWHLHGGDPVDGAISETALRKRQKQRGVDWAVTTHHSRVAPSADAQHGVVGSEWSGEPVDRATFKAPWPTAHVLMLGAPDVLAPAVGNDVFAAIADARAGGGSTMIVAHAWRTPAGVRDAPTFDDWIAAGVHGFEVGNRRRDTDPAMLERLREIDRGCRERGLLRFSFSDDHGRAAGSPCVTFLEGVTEAELNARGGPAVLAGLRSAPTGAAAVIPLLFHPGDPTRLPPRWLLPAAVTFEYFRSLAGFQFVSWLAFVVLAATWVLRAPRGR